jgi:hypothetical protein
MKYHIILETNGTVKQLSQRAHTFNKAIRRARKLAVELFPGKGLTNTSTGCILKEYTEVYVLESGGMDI